MARTSDEDALHELRGRGRSQRCLWSSWSRQMLRAGALMKLGRVSGTVVSTINHFAYENRTLLMCDLLDAAGEDTGGYLICVDAVGAGAGELVLILDEGNGARQIVGMPDAPIRAVVVGIVDDLMVES